MESFLSKKALTLRMAQYSLEKGFSTRRQNVIEEDGVDRSWTFSCRDAPQCPFRAEARLQEDRSWELSILKASHNHSMNPKAHQAQIEQEYLYTPRPNFLDAVNVRQQAPVTPPPQTPSMNPSARLSAPPRFTNARYNELGGYLKNLP
ncbi:MAG: hypothetical protein J3Q66DRAFT_434839 [Benniella sp.]|nr:MAG: hypothetical protein J3Q66DRAFT_434839 [Benniella sp.]